MQRIRASLLLLGLLAVLPNSSGSQVFAADQRQDAVFDAPLEVLVTALDPDPLNPQVKRQVTCSRYPRFWVKEVDSGEVGAERLSVLPAAPGVKPSCSAVVEPGERVIENAVWSGYFAGVKGDYALFWAGDGTVGHGMPFLVLRVPDNTLVFSDIAAGAAGDGMSLQSLTVEKGGLRIRYVRNFEAGGCSVVTDGPGCAEKIAALTGVAGDLGQACRQGYEKDFVRSVQVNCAGLPVAQAAECVAKRGSAEQRREAATSPSAVSYRVEAFIPADAGAFDTRDAGTIQARAKAFLKNTGPVQDCRPFL